jgi:hypothetical protein
MDRKEFYRKLLVFVVFSVVFGVVLVAEIILNRIFA